MNPRAAARPSATRDTPRASTARGAGVAAFSAVVVLVVMVAVLTLTGSVPLALLTPPALVVVGGLVWLGLRYPMVALGYFLVAVFFRLALPRVLPIDAFLPAFGGLILSCAIWLRRNPGRAPRPGVVEVAMMGYLAWNVVSVVTPHDLPAVTYFPTVAPLDLTRMLLTAVIMPFTLYYVGRTLGGSARWAEVIAWMVLAFGAFSTLVSILQFHAPALVWPRYIVLSPNWVGRANGVPNQPVVNGIILVVSFSIAMYLASRRSEPTWRRVMLIGYIAACAYAVFLTHTRIIYVALLLVLVLGAVCARGFRRGFAIAGGIGIVLIAANWSTFTSSDREKGGVGSTSEVFDRLNTAATSFWAYEQKPVLGWGLGRFISVDTLHHQQWTPDIPFEHGLGIASHFNELGILVELGLVGLVLWLAVLVLLAARVVPMLRAPRDDSTAFAHAMAVCAALALIVMVTAGTAVDLRLFDFPTVLVMLVVGVAVGQIDSSRRIDAPVERGVGDVDSPDSAPRKVSI